MRRTMHLTRGAVLAVTLALPAIRAGAQAPPGAGPYPSTQQFGEPLPAGASSQFGVGGDGSGAMGAPGSAGAPGTAGVPGAGGPVGPDGAPLSAPGDAAGSGAFAGANAGAGAGAGAGAAGGGGGGFAPNLGGFSGGSATPPGLVGDFPPVLSRLAQAPGASRFPNLPGPVPPGSAPGGNSNSSVTGNNANIIYKLTGLKISDNMSPRPQDRIFYSFNYFDNVNASINKRFGTPVENLQVYHSLFGLEKTFLDGRASIGFRMPLNTLTLKSPLTGVGGSTTTTGDLSIFTKYALYSDDRGNLISLGLQVTPPTGPGGFAGNKNFTIFRDTQIQPFVGFIFVRDRFFTQGFASVNVPTMSQDVTLLFNDLAVGYYVYRAADTANFLRALVPTAEVHVTTPLNHRGSDINDRAATPEIVNMTFGANAVFRRNTTLTAAYVTPVTGPKPFNAELVLLLNIRFGRSARSTLPNIPIAQ